MVSYNQRLHHLGDEKVTKTEEYWPKILQQHISVRKRATTVRLLEIRHDKSISIQV